MSGNYRPHNQQQQRGLPPRLQNYNTVNERRAAFREDYGDFGCIRSEYRANVPIDGWVLFTATVSVRTEEGAEWVLGNGSAAIPIAIDYDGRDRDPKSGKPYPAENAWEKGETSAVGRALVNAGYTSDKEEAKESGHSLPRENSRRRNEDAAVLAPGRVKVAPAPGHKGDTPDAVDEVLAEERDLSGLRPGFRAVVEHIREMGREGADFEAIKAFAASKKASMNDDEYARTKHELGIIRHARETAPAPKQRKLNEASADERAEAVLAAEVLEELSEDGDEEGAPL